MTKPAVYENNAEGILCVYKNEKWLVSIKNWKPDPEPYRKAMEYLGANPRECLIIEDSPVGIQAGKAAGAWVVGFRGSRIIQNTSQADFQLDTFANL